ncbi:MAG: hypothetical protein IJ796_04335 [Lachnospiraceae bacterium]|nr:hypothetical protein [Lachnospiraceae bacterium]
MKKGLTASTVKIIAMVCMFIDHAAASVLQGLLYAGRFNMESALPDSLTGGDAMYTTPMGMVYLLLRGIGRISFPLYCFFIVEGLKYTRSRLKYFLRLIIFAFISEVPFDLAIFGTPFYPLYQNVYFTLAIGLAMIWGIDTFKERENGKALTVLFWLCAIVFAPFALASIMFQWLYSFFGQIISGAGVRVFFVGLWVVIILATVVSLLIVSKKTKKELSRKILVIIAFAGTACVLSDQTDLFGTTTDYGAIGIITILVMYLLREYKMPEILAGCGALTFFNFFEAPGFLAVPIIKAYNGERGKYNKYIFYAFYPLHLLILGLICLFFKINPTG